MNVDITERQINMKLLDSAIKAYKAENDCAKVYIFMNKETAKVFTLSHDFELFTNWSYSIFSYLENNVYIDDLSVFKSVINIYIVF